MEVLIPALLDALVEGDHYLLIVIMFVLLGAWRWWLTVQKHVCALLDRLLKVMEAIANNGLQVEVHHRHQEDVTLQLAEDTEDGPTE